MAPCGPSRCAPGVMFHNGDELTAEDVVASLERWRRVGPKGPALDELERFEIIDDHTLALHFSSPKGRFLLLLLGSDENKAVIMPKEVAEASPEGGTLSEVVGTGPYRFVEYREDQFVRLERFADYAARSDAPDYQTGNKVAYPDELLFWIVPEASTRVAGLEAGEYDIITNVPDAEFQRLEGTDGVVPVKNGPGVLLYMMFNHQHGPTADINFRRAVQAIVDAEQVVAAAVADPAFATVNPSFYPPESAYNTDACAALYNQVDADKAREYLAASNYAGEKVIVPDHRHLGQPRAHRTLHRRANAVDRHQRRDGEVRRADLGGQAPRSGCAQYLHLRRLLDRPVAVPPGVQRHFPGRRTWATTTTKPKRYSAAWPRRPTSTSVTLSAKRCSASSTTR